MSDGVVMERLSPMSPRRRPTFHVEARSCAGGFVLDAFSAEKIATTTASAECSCESGDLVSIWQAFLSAEEQQYFSEQKFGTYSGPEFSSPYLDKIALPSEEEFIGTIALQALRNHGLWYPAACQPTASGLISLAVEVLGSLNVPEDRTPRVVIPLSGSTPTAVQTCPERLVLGRENRQEAKVRFVEDFCWRLLTCRLVRSSNKLVTPKKRGRLSRRRQFKDSGSQCGASNGCGGALEVSQFCLLVTSLHYVALDLLIKLAEKSSLACLDRQRGPQGIDQNASHEFIIVSRRPHESLSDIWAAFCDISSLFSRQPLTSCDETLLLQVACLADASNVSPVTRRAVHTSKEILLAKWLRLMSLLCPDNATLPFPASHRLVPYRDIGLGIGRQWSARTFAIYHSLVARLQPYFEAGRSKGRHRSMEADQMPVGGDVPFLLAMADNCIRAFAAHESTQKWLAERDDLRIYSYLSLMILPESDDSEGVEVVHTTTPVRKVPLTARAMTLPLPSLNDTERRQLHEDCLLSLDLLTSLTATNTTHLKNIIRTHSKRQTFKMKRDLMVSLLDRTLILFALATQLDQDKAKLLLEKGLEFVRCSYLARSALHVPHATSAQTASSRRKRCGCIGQCSQELSPVCGSQIWPEVTSLLRTARQEASSTLNNELAEWERISLARFPDVVREQTLPPNKKPRSFFDGPAFAFGMLIAAMMFAFFISYAVSEHRVEFRGRNTFFNKAPIVKMDEKCTHGINCIPF